MKKYRKLTRIISLVFALCMLMSVTGVAAEFKSEFELSVPAEVRQAMEAQQPALEAYQNLWTTLPKKSDGTPDYPAEYGGAYIDSDRGYKLVVKLTENTTIMQQKYINWCKNSANILFESAQYSMNYLEGLSSYATDFADAGYSVVCFGVDQRESELLIKMEPFDYIENNSSLIQTYSASAINSLPIRIEFEEHGISYTNLNGGDGLKNNFGGPCTVGIGGTFGGNPSVLTCGHTSFVGNPVKAAGTNTEIGRISYRRAYVAPSDTATDTSINSLGDFSIVALNSGYTPTNNVRSVSGGLLDITGVVSPVAGTTVYKYGATTGYSWGQITVESASYYYYVSYSYYTDLHYTRGLFIANLVNSSGTPAAAAGDSGGPVYVDASSSHKLVGIITGGPTNPVNGKYITYCTNINWTQGQTFNGRTFNILTS